MRRGRSCGEGCGRALAAERAATLWYVARPGRMFGGVLCRLIGVRLRRRPRVIRVLLVILALVFLGCISVGHMNGWDAGTVVIVLASISFYAVVWIALGDKLQSVRRPGVERLSLPGHEWWRWDEYLDEDRYGPDGPKYIRLVQLWWYVGILPSLGLLYLGVQALHWLRAAAA